MSDHGYEDQFLGERQVKAVAPEGETRTGSQLLRVHFTNGTSEVWSERMLDTKGVLTPTISDASSLRNARMYPVVAGVMGVMLDYNLKAGEVQFLTQLIIGSFNENLNAGDRHLWNASNLEDRTMQEIDSVLMQRTEPRPTLDDVLGKPGA